ncbi:alpha/beta fold hydrolase [Mycobacteroides chelonae]|uniref:alpha/beta fold hydrolase n=1 Tax=Mycobacteroides chelonae TaxID=1774 RepID=UPI003AB0CA3B
MPFFDAENTSLYYEEQGSGHPILLLAPGGLRSSIPYWERVAWNPIQELSAHYRVITMDQRNAGQSSARVTGQETWATYASDQLSLLDHLGIDRFHVLGMCIGGSFIAKLATTAPERITAAVVAQTIGQDDNLATFREIFDEWSTGLVSTHPEADDTAWQKYWNALFINDNRVFSVPDTELRNIRVPLLVLNGDDRFHPAIASRALVDAVPDAQFIERWKETDELPAAREAVSEFLKRHTPA